MDVEAKAKSSLTTEDTENTEEEEVVVTAVLCRSGSRNGFRWLSGEPYHTALEIFSKFRYFPVSAFPFSPIRDHLPSFAGPSPLRVSLCTAEDCHGYNKFSPWLCASVRAPSNFLPFAGPKPQKNLTPAIE
jgi:hypothetical protein